MANGRATYATVKRHFEYEMRPNPRQRLFFASTKRRILYGGAKGGGKSWAMREKFVLLAMRFDGLKLLLLRRTLPELRNNHVRPLRALIEGYARYNDDEKAFVFPNGSIIQLGYCDSDNDVLQYQGQEYDVVGFEEACLFTEYMLTEIALVARNVRSDFTPRVYYTANPGGPGHAYIKRLFVDRNFKDGEDPDDYEFIPAKVTDNTVLMENSPEYIRALDALPEDRRRALRDGDWDVFDGQYFPEFRRHVHVVEPFMIPQHWRKYLAIDYGLDMMAALWIAVDTRGKAYVYREVYRPNLLVSQASQAMKRAMEFDSTGRRYGPMDQEYLYQQMAPPDLFARNKETGKSVVERLNEDGWAFGMSKNSRVQGWYELKEWLKVCATVDEQTGKEVDATNLVIFDTCPNLIRCLPLLQHDEHDPNDVATEPHELTHAPDALRYWVTGRPTPTETTVHKARVVWEPDQYEDYENTTPEIQQYLLKIWGDPF
jgi:phage terminase large subunit